ncbi:MAG: oxidoreductase [Rhodobacteraceae bacterium]|nr:oxidoreductase [Paracoccaceae bacterium]
MTMVEFTVRVAAVRHEAEGIVSLELVAPDGGALPAFSAGAHVDVLLPGLPARQYSLCNPPSETHRYQIAVLREPASRGGSRHLHECVTVDDVLTLGGPRNHFPLAPEARRSLLIAGGIGITPLLAMAEALSTAGARFDLHYCARSRDRMAFAGRLATAPYRDRVHLHLDDGPSAQHLEVAKVLAAPLPGDHLYVCGPSGFLDWIRRAAAAEGWPEERVHTEYFSGQVDQRDDDAAFEIEVQDTGLIVPVAKGQTALNALLAAGIDVPHSCEEGVCGMCMTQVLDGTPDHRDQFLTAGERKRNDCFMPCCSRALSARLVVTADY